MPPWIIEQLVNQLNSIKFAVDIWSYGILGFKLLFGRHPFLSKIEEEKLSNTKKLEILYKKFKNGNYKIDLSKEYVNEVSKEALIFFDEVLNTKRISENPIRDILKLKFIRTNPSKFNKISERDLNKEPEDDDENNMELPSQLRRDEKKTVLTLDINSNEKLATLNGFNDI